MKVNTKYVGLDVSKEEIAVVLNSQDRTPINSINYSTE